MIKQDVYITKLNMLTIIILIAIVSIWHLVQKTTVPLNSLTEVAKVQTFFT